ncbi:helicase [Aureococcus anophagefferens]|nr:helicase [Aureococcus anophagefferens]
MARQCRFFDATYAATKAWYATSQSLVEAADDADRAGLLQMGSAARVGARRGRLRRSATTPSTSTTGEEAKDADRRRARASAPAAYAKVHEQAVDRCHRIGQTKPVAAAFYDAALTIDDCMRHVNDIKLDKR